MVNVLTKQPKKEFSITAQQQAGSWHHYITSADVWVSRKSTITFNPITFGARARPQNPTEKSKFLRTVQSRC
jgi:hypothetical protein